MSAGKIAESNLSLDYSIDANKFGYDVYAAFLNHPNQPISFHDIESVEKEWTDGNDEPEYKWLFKLKDGRFAFGSGGHDYTGWDCQSGFSVLGAIGPREEVIRYAMTLNDREDLGLLLPEEVKQ
jgi:hypothetical protein